MLVIVNNDIIIVIEKNDMGSSRTRGGHSRNRNGGFRTQGFRVQVLGFSVWGVGLNASESSESHMCSPGGDMSPPGHEGGTR